MNPILLSLPRALEQAIDLTSVSPRIGAADIEKTEPVRSQR
jgi:hypothetical protein